MPNAKITSKGQVTIPADIRRALGVDTGDYLAFETAADYVVVRRAPTIDEVAARFAERRRGMPSVAMTDDEGVEAYVEAYPDTDAAEEGDELYVVGRPAGDDQ